MNSTMRANLFVFVCCGCVAHGRRSLSSNENEKVPQPLSSFSTMLLALHPVVGSVHRTSPSTVGLSDRGGRRPTAVMQQTSQAATARTAALTAGLLGLASSSKALAAVEVDVWSTKEFLDAVNNNLVEKVSISNDGTSILCIDTDGNRHESRILPGQANEITELLQKKDISFTVQPKGAQQQQANDAFGGLGGIFFNLLPFGILLFLSSRNGMGGGGPGAGGPMGGMNNPMGVGKSRAKIQMEPDTGVTFNDVAGADGAKLELTEVVDFLKNPTKYSSLGAKIPKGVIMEGPPGTGKTLLARAVAGEAGVPFISASGSEFVEMFVGVGASRVRDIFGQAKKNAPCIMFIDEIDAIGRQRGGTGMPGNEEREQTLNQILTEMDGFEGNTGVIVIAATNRADVLDNALIRPGRFDRRVPVDLPDVEGRKQILNVHVRGKPLSPDIDLGVIAKRTIGFSGASLANLMNEAAIVSARNGKTEIGYDEIDYAIDRITVGMQKQTGMSFPTRQKLVAYHEAGHAIMGLIVPDYDMVTKVTIIPRTSGAGGFTLFTPTEERMDSGMYSKKYLCSQLAVALGGRVAEELIYGKDEITTGASNDLQQVRSIARRMVAQWGFANEAMGEAPVAWEAEQGNTIQTPNAASPKTEKQIDEQVKILVNCAYETTLNSLTANRDFLDKLADALVEKETIDYNELERMRDLYASKEPAYPLVPEEMKVAA